MTTLNSPRPGEPYQSSVHLPGAESLGSRSSTRVGQRSQLTSHSAVRTYTTHSLSRFYHADPRFGRPLNVTPRQKSRRYTAVKDSLPQITHKQIMSTNMVPPVSRTAVRGLCGVPHRAVVGLMKPLLFRYQSSSASFDLPAIKTSPNQAHPVAQDSCLKRVSTWSLVRNVAVSFFLTRPMLLKPGMAMMRTVANSKSPLLNPDLNPLLRVIIKPFIYDQFCAGTNKSEIQKTIGEIQKLGFAGVILCYAKEALIGDGNTALDSQGQREAEIQNWLDGNLETLNMIETGNWLGIKFTGAGQDIMEALLQGRDAPPAFAKAMAAIAEKARSQGCRIWIDAEQQAVQSTIDRWTIDLMRKYNRGSDVLIYTTIQAYLKQSRPKLQWHLTLAAEEGWNLAVKLVRGAYIATDIRARIHDTKEETDASYNGIVRDLLTGNFEGFTPQTLPHTSLFLAGHNSATVRAALELAKDLSDKGELKVYPEFGQLQGMVDDLGGEIIRFGEMIEAERSTKVDTTSSPATFVPRVYKCLTWGSIQECMLYLIRRAVENSAAVGRMKECAAEARKELMRRFSLRRLLSQRSSP